MTHPISTTIELGPDHVPMSLVRTAYDKHGEARRHISYSPFGSLGRTLDRRKFTLLEIVTLFDVSRFGDLLTRLQWTETHRSLCVNLTGESTASDVHIDDVIGIFRDVHEWSIKTGFFATLHAVEHALDHLDSNRYEIGLETITSEARRVRQSLLDEADDQYFVQILRDRSDYLDAVSLFGPEVDQAFPGARADIRDAGNCIAVECNTAAVFHLMRVAEIGLRALARDRRIVVPKKTPLELATWEDIIKELEKSEDRIRNYKKTLARESQLEFYHCALMEFKRFKNVWRNRVMHTREEYDREQALSALNHVGNFMKILAGKISETSRTPLIWKMSMK